MLAAQLLSLVLANSNMIFGNQGYCVFEFTLQDKVTNYSQVEIVLRPQYDPNDTATTLTHLDDIKLDLNRVGRKRTKARSDTDCQVTGFDVIQASGIKKGQSVDLIGSSELEIGKSQLPITISGH